MSNLVSSIVDKLPVIAWTIIVAVMMYVICLIEKHWHKKQQLKENNNVSAEPFEYTEEEMGKMEEEYRRMFPQQNERNHD